MNKTELYINMKLKKYVITNNRNVDIIAECNHTYGILLRKVILYENRQLKYSMKQKNVLIKLLSCIPIITNYIVPPYKIYKNNMVIGVIKTKYFTPYDVIHFNNDIIYLELLSQNEVKLFFNGTDIVTIRKDSLVIDETDKYEVYYNDFFNLELITLFVTYINFRFFYKNTFNWHFSTVRYEKVFVKKIK